MNDKVKYKTHLTSKQEKFAQCIASGMTQAEAYKSSYNVRPDTKEETAYVKGCVLMSNENIRNRVEELKAPIIKKVEVTLENHIHELENLRDAAKIDKKWTAAIQAEIARGKVCGLYVEKVLLGNPDGETFKTSVDLSKLSDEELSQLILLREKIDKKDDNNQ